MRTTVDLEDDILMAVKEIARRQDVTMGKVLSDLARQALLHHPNLTHRNGFPLFPVQSDGGVVSLELVNQLRDETP